MMATLPSSPEVTVTDLKRDLHELHNHYGLLLAIAYRHLVDLGDAGVAAPLLAPLWAELDAAVTAYHQAHAATVPEPRARDGTAGDMPTHD